MSVIHYNGQQLSIFNYEKAKISREDFIQSVERQLGLKPTPRMKVMVEACTMNPELFNEKQRRFLKQCAIAVFDQKQLTSAQHDYLAALYFKTVN
mgnify:CR=1 FL=1